ncbi:MAG: hypothetical protein IPM98_06325 [Lewinellaceae bacterium]|nr:hypothetical protein [Lewinellaceae bacterium]
MTFLSIRLTSGYPFQVTKGDGFSGSVLVPNTSNLFVLLKKSNRLGYSSTWHGSLNIYKESSDLFQIDGEYDYLQTGFSGADFDLHVKNAEAYLYAFEIETTKEQGKGQIMFTDQLPALSLGQWSLGEILRPYGYDWLQVDIPGGVDTFFLRTEGYGLWSYVQIYFEEINTNSQKWLFKNWGNGYHIEAAIPNPVAGRYYIQYMDSGVLYGDNGKYASDEGQRRQYLIRADISQIPPAPGLPLTITGVSVDTIGRGRITFDIYGTGFQANDVIELKEEERPCNQNNKPLMKAGKPGQSRF